MEREVRRKSKKNNKMDVGSDPAWIAYMDKFITVPPEIIARAVTLRPSGKKAALIVEPRNHPLLERVVNNFYSKLIDHDFVFIIVHGTKNVDLAESMSRRLPHVRLWNMGKENICVGAYNCMMARPHFWIDLINRFCPETVLIFQTDTLLLKDNIEDFLQWDYIGAPWSDNPEARGGNGGLSLRKVLPTLRTALRIPYEFGMGNEDIYYSKYMHELGYDVAPSPIGIQFSCESIVSKDPFGLHKPYIWEKIKHLVQEKED